MKRKKYTFVKTTATRNHSSTHPANYFVPIIEKAKHGIVSIETSDLGTDRSMNKLVFDFLFPDTQYTAPSSRSYGTGFIIHPKGYILTSEHVVNRARNIHVKLYNSTMHEAKMVWADSQRDLAVLRIYTRKGLPILPLGSSREAKVGELVVAIGNPVGLDNTVTTGVISAKNRPVRIEGRQYEDVIQTDAAINPGNSGGPLINLNGEVIGMNAFILKETQSLGFAIGIDSIKPRIQKYVI